MGIMRDIPLKGDESRTGKIIRKLRKGTHEEICIRTDVFREFYDDAS